MSETCYGKGIIQSKPNEAGTGGRGRRKPRRFSAPERSHRPAVRGGFRQIGRRFSQGSGQRITLVYPKEQISSGVAGFPLTL